MYGIDPSTGKGHLRNVGTHGPSIMANRHRIVSEIYKVLHVHRRTLPGALLFRLGGFRSTGRRPHRFKAKVSPPDGSPEHRPLVAMEPRADRLGSEWNLWKPYKHPGTQRRPFNAQGTQQRPEKKREPRVGRAGTQGRPSTRRSNSCFCV